MTKRLLSCFLLLLYVSLSSFAMKVISPIDYGLKDAKNGVERYNILMRCHQDAIAHGYGISYRGIKVIDLDVPQSPRSIPLPYFTDFAGVELRVNNNRKTTFLFELTNQLQNIDVEVSDIDVGKYYNYTNLKNGDFILVLEDQEPWSERRNYNAYATRKDIILIKNGTSIYRPIQSYDTQSTKLLAQYRKVSKEKKIVKNVKFTRSQSSTYKTYLLTIENEYNIELDGIEIYTPDNDVEYADAAIHIINCVDVSLKNIHIQGTYSLENKAGYGVYLNNICNIKVKKMYARSKWGVFGTHNLQNVVLDRCDINRFDIHCYGKNVRVEKCKFVDMYNQFSSIYGTISFNKCEFENFIPMLIESSYNAYTPFDVVWKKCTFHLDKKHNYIMTLFGVPKPYNSRFELRRKCLPNITLKNCRVIIDDDLEKWYLIHTGGVKYQDSFDYVSNVNIDVDVYGKASIKYVFSTEPLKTTNKINIKEKIRESDNE